MTPTTFVLPHNLGFTAAAKLAADLSALRGRNLVVDASEVESVGALCLQALISARLTWASDRLAWAIIATSPAFAEATALSGADLSRCE